MFLLYIKRIWTMLFRIFPINKNKIFFTSYEGKQYSCNPKYIYLKFLEKGNFQYQYAWEYNFENVPDEINLHSSIVVRHNSVRYFYHLLTSRIVITNSGITASIALRKNQICINTWHGGGAYKKVGAVISEAVNGTSKRALVIAAKQTTYFISSSRMFTDVMIPSVKIERKKFLKIGMPRNDVFFDQSKIINLKEKVCKYYNLSENDKIVLFAPTYRGTSRSSITDIPTPNTSVLLDVLQERFGGEWRFMYRTHYYGGKLDKKNSDIIDVSDYPDMQELLCTADVLITDYSSSIWDYSLTGRPCFLFVPDLEEYNSNRGGFYTDIESWLGITARNDTELSIAIKEYDSREYALKIKTYHRKSGTYESGTSSCQILKYIESE